MASHAPAHGHHEEHQTSPAEYVKIAAILAVITLVEVIIYYVPSFRGFLVPVLVVLSVAKFAAVVGYFMHLKFDSRLFRYMFVTGLLLSLAVFIAMIAMFVTAHSWQPLVLPFAS